MKKMIALSLLSATAFSFAASASTGDLSCQSKDGSAQATVKDGTLTISTKTASSTFTVQSSNRTGETTVAIIGYSAVIGQHAEIIVDSGNGKALVQGGGVSGYMQCTK